MRYILRSKQKRLFVEFFEEYFETIISNGITQGKYSEELTIKLNWDGDYPYASSRKLNANENCYIIELNKAGIDYLINYVVRYKSAAFEKIPVNNTLVHDYNFLHLNRKKYSDAHILAIHLIFVHIIAHEYAHIILGHTDYSFYNPDEVLPPYYEQYEECDADFCGFSLAFGAIYKLCNKNTYQSFILYLEIISCIWSSVYNLQELEPIEEYINIPHTHPHPQTRMRYMIDWIKEIVKKPIFGLNEDEQKEFRFYCEIVSEQFNYMTGSKPMNVFTALRIQEEEIAIIDGLEKQVDPLFEHYKYITVESDSIPIIED